MLNPCCCLSPRIGVFVFAILDMVMAVTYTWAVLETIFNYGLKGEMIGEIIMCVVVLTMATLLLLGAWKNSAEKIRLWLILWIVFVILMICFQVFNIVQQHTLGPRTGGSLLGFLLLIYQIWVVYAYLHELRCGPAGLTYCPTQITV